MKKKKKPITGKQETWSALKNTDDGIVKVPETTQDVIPINTVTQRGTFEIEADNGGFHLFDRVYKFDDINYTTKDNHEREGILIRYCNILNSLNVNFKIVIANLKRDPDDVKDTYVGKSSQTDMERLFSDSCNKIIDDKLNNDVCYIDQNRYLVITIKRKTYKEADAYFDQIENQLMSDFQGFGSELIEVDGIERLNILYKVFRMDSDLKFADTWDDMLAGEFKDSIAPQGIKPVDKKGIQYLQIDGKYISTLVIRKNGYPSQLSNQFMQQIMSLTYQSIVTLDVVPVPQDVLKDVLQKKLDSVEVKIARQQEVRNKNEQYSSDITHNVKKEKSNILKYIEDVDENDQKMFFTQLLITIYADTEEELENRIENIQHIGRSSMLDVVPYCLQQLEAFMTALPLGGRYVNTMSRTLFTNALVAFVPFNVQELHHPKGKYYGTNIISKKIVVGDRRLLLNGNGWIFGVPGSGKTFFSKFEMGQILAGTNDVILIIDPQNEYQEFVESFGGQYINLSAASKTYINPLEISKAAVEAAYIPEYVTTKSEFVLDTLNQIMLNAKGGLTLQERSYLDKATRHMYFDILNKPEKQWESPTFVTLQQYLYALDKPDATTLAESLYTFAEGSLSLFAHQSNVTINNRLVAFGIRDLGKSLKRLSMLIMLEAIRNRLSYNQSKGILTWVYGDEIHELTSEEFTALALERFYKEVRKQGGFMTGMTQNVTDCLISKTTKTMIANSEYIMMLNQADVDIASLSSVVSISQNEQKYLQSGESGRGLLKFGKSIIPLDAYVDKSKAPEIYDLFNTNIHEKIAAGYFERSN